jgi:hypothetical protein
MTERQPFANRQAAGQALAEALAGKSLTDPVVLALPRGGAAVAAEVARRLKAPLDLVLVRKIGVPFQRELAAAAIVDGGAPEIVTNDDVMALCGLTRADVNQLARRVPRIGKAHDLATAVGQDLVECDGSGLDAEDVGDRIALDEHDLLGGEAAQRALREGEGMIQAAHWPGIGRGLE